MEFMFSIILCSDVVTFDFLLIEAGTCYTIVEKILPTGRRPAINKTLKKKNINKKNQKAEVPFAIQFIIFKFLAQLP